MMFFQYFASNKTIGTFQNKALQTTILSYYVVQKLLVQIKLCSNCQTHQHKNEVIIVTNQIHCCIVEHQSF